MKQSLLQTYEGQIRTGTWELSKRLGSQHRFIKSCIERKKEAFIDLGDLPHVKIKEERPGRPVIEYLLNREQCGWVIFLSSICGDRKALTIQVRSNDCKTDTEYFKYLDDNL